MLLRLGTKWHWPWAVLLLMLMARPLAGQDVVTSTDDVELTIATTSTGQVGIEEPDDDNTAISGTLTVTASAVNTVSSNLLKSYFAIPINNGSVTGFDVGALIPLTVNGTASLLGVQYAEAFKCSLNAINNNQGMIRNISLLYSIQDSGADQNEAFDQALLLERRGTFAVVGPQSDSQVQPVANLYNTANIPLVSYGAGGVNLGNSTFYPTFLRVWPPDTAQARAMAETMRLLGWTYIAALFTNDNYGQSGRQAFLAAAARQRVRVTCLNNIQPNATQGLAAFSQCLSESTASVVLLWMGPQSASAVLSVLYSNPLNNGTTFVAPNQWALVSNMTQFIDYGRAVTGLTFPSSYVQGTASPGKAHNWCRHARILPAGRIDRHGQGLLLPNQPGEHKLHAIQRGLAKDLFLPRHHRRYSAAVSGKGQGQEGAVPVPGQRGLCVTAAPARHQLCVRCGVGIRVRAQLDHESADMRPDQWRGLLQSDAAYQHAAFERGNPGLVQRHDREHCL